MYFSSFLDAFRAHKNFVFFCLLFTKKALRSPNNLIYNTTLVSLLNKHDWHTLVVSSNGMLVKRYLRPRLTMKQWSYKHIPMMRRSASSSYWSPSTWHTVKINYYWFRDMPKFDFSEKSLGIISPPHFVHDFSNKCFSCYILLTDKISLPDSLYLLRYWVTCVLQLFVSQVAT